MSKSHKALGVAMWACLLPSVGMAQDQASAGSAGPEPYKVYLGLDRMQATMNLSSNDLVQRFGDDRLHGGFYRAQAGLRLSEGLAVEAQGGFLPDDGNNLHDAEFGHFYATYFIATGTVLDTVEISARVGYAWLGMENPQAQKNFDGFSYGGELALPTRVLSKASPNLRLFIGGAVLTQGAPQRAYGWNGGIRYDFDL